MEEMTGEEVRRVVEQSWFGHLGLAEGSRAYVVPLFYGFDGESFYFHAEHGQKDQFIHSTEEACLVVDAVRSEEDWTSVMAFGHVHEVHDADERLAGMDALMRAPLPPEWGFTEAGEARHGEEVVLYRLTPHRMTGRKSRSADADRHADEVAVGGM